MTKYGDERKESLYEWVEYVRREEYDGDEKQFVADLADILHEEICDELDVDY